MSIPLKAALAHPAFPASALITCAGFARTDMMVEIQGIAMVGA